MNVNRAFIEHENGYFNWLKEKMSEFGVEVVTTDDFDDLFDLNSEISKAGESNDKGLDLVAIDLKERPTKLDEHFILNGLESWKYSVIYSCVKNYRNSIVLVDPDDFKLVIESLNECGDITLQDRRLLSLKALYRLLRIGSLTHKELSELFATEKFETLILEEIIPLRYGENPHQFAHISKIAKEKAFFDFVDEDKLFSMSYNNLVDLHLAIVALKSLGSKFAVRVHHGSIVEVKKQNLDFEKARGVLVANFVNDDLIEALKENELDVVALPDTSKVKAKKILNFDESKIVLSDKLYRHLDGNFIVQTSDELDKMRFISEKNDEQYRWANVIAALSNSMACCIFKNGEMLALGSGQPDQIDAMEIALIRAKRESKDVSDAIFAFDGPIKDMRVVDALITIGTGTIIEPGGSKKDKEVKERIENAGMKIVFSGKRRYKH